MKALLLTIFLVPLTLLVGCSTVTEAGYYWGNYSSTLYAYTKSPSDVTQLAHIETLQDIVDKSNEKGLRVPPGIFAELGYLSSKRNEVGLAIAYYDEEARLYPESKILLERLIASSNRESGNEDN
ncbi:DUF4810 domain-containing protein [Haliea sp.]